MKFLYLIIKILCKFFNFKMNKNRIRILNDEDSINYLIKKDLSFIRLGDGEFTIMWGGDLYFQKNSIKLLSCLWKIIFLEKKRKFIIGLPPLNYMNDNKIFCVSLFTLNFLPKDKLYLSSFIFRPESSISNELIEQLWINYDKIIFISSNFKYFIDFKNKYSNKDVVFFKINSANSFSNFEKLKNKVKKMIDVNKKTCILISGGVMAKCFVYEFTKLNIDNLKILDMGHYFDYKFYNLDYSYYKKNKFTKND